MPFSKRENDGYVLIDHRDSPGFTLDQARAAGRSRIAPFVGAGKRLEAATITCAHWPCGRVVVINPDRVRQRNYCPKCDHYICDWCEAERVRTGICKPFKKGAEEYLDAVRKASAAGNPFICIPA